MTDDITRKALERLFTAFTVKGGGEDGTASSWSKRVEDALVMASVALDTKPPVMADLLVELSLHVVLERMELDETSFVRFSVEEEEEEVAIILATTNPQMVKVLSKVDASSLTDRPLNLPPTKPKADFNIN